MKKIVFILFVLACQSYSQNIKFDKNTLKKITKKTGIPAGEVKKILKDQDISLPEQIDGFDVGKDKIKNDEKKNKIRDDLKKAYGTDITNDVTTNKKNKFENDLLDTEKELISKETTINDQPTLADKYFGYDVFKRDPELFQASISESVDPNYTIGPGDEIILMLWGEIEINEKHLIEKDGYLFIPNIGQVFVNGLTLTKLENKLFKLLKRVHSSLEPDSGQPTSFLDVSLGSLVLRPIRIFVLGEIDQPGAYSVKPSTSLFTSLYYFNGPSLDGSLRNISLIRKGKKITSIDFYDLLLKGEKINDVRLQRDDVVFINKRGKSITVSGEISRPAIFEMKINEGLINLINMAGGVKSSTYLKRAQIKRITPLEKRMLEGIDRRIIDIDLKSVVIDKKDYNLYDGDEITFFKINDSYQNIVTLEGSIIRPGVYQWNDGLRISELIEKADGILGDTYFDRADIERINKDYTKSQIDINLRKALDGDDKNNIELYPNDLVTIHSISDMLYKTDVKISGHVLDPGEKEFKRGMQVSDLIFLGGGFNNEEHLGKAYFERAELTRLNPETFTYNSISFRLDSVLSGKGIADMYLQMGDEIMIYSKDDIIGSIAQTVSVDGPAKRSGEFKYYSGMTLYDLLFMSVGVEDEKHMETIFTERADLLRYDSKKLNKEIIAFDLLKAFDRSSTISSLKLFPGDQVKIYSNDIFKNSFKVKIEGDIKNPGEYDLKTDMKLKDLIFEAGGVNSNLFRYRLELSRVEPTNTKEELFANILTYDIINDSESYMNDESKNPLNILLEPYDIISIRPDPYFTEFRKVTINGFVYYPGEYTITNPNEKVTDIIDRAGGLRPEAYPPSSQLTRNGQEVKLSFKKIINNPNSKYNFNVMAGDVINIDSKPNLVVIEGEVNNPGNYKYMRGYRLNDYIKAAGGFTIDAAKSATYVVYPDGSSAKLSYLNFSPNVQDGSKIIVARKGEVEPFNFTDYVSSITTIFTDITQAWLMIIIALRG